MNRRKFLKSTAGASACVVLPAGLSGKLVAQSGSIPVSSSALGGNLHLLSGAGGNIVVQQNESGLVLVDSGDGPQAEALLSFLDQAFNTDNVSHLFNTHWHLDHTGNNEVFAKNGAEIIAHENTRLWMGTEIISRWEDEVYPARADIARPTNTFFYDVQTLGSGDSRIEYDYLLQGHTDGDIYVYFPEQNVMAGGGVITGDTYPVFDYSTNGWIGGMINSLQQILDATNDDTLFIPGSGTARTRSDVEAQREMCLSVLKKISENYYSGSTFADLIASEPTSEFDATWGDPETFLITAYESAWWHVTELRRFA